MQSPVEKIARDKVVETICSNYQVPAQDIPDLAQHIYLVLCEYDQDKIDQMYTNGQIMFFLSRLVANNYYSRTSRYYYTFKKYNEIIDTNKDVTDYE